jgi:hypothetical protein
MTYIRKAMASRCDGFSRPHISIDWRKQAVSVSVLSARITLLLSQETAQSRILILVGLFNRPPIVEISPLLRQ